jgi:hypothetical protein
MRKLTLILLAALAAKAQNTANFPGAVSTTAQMGVASNRAETVLATGVNATATSLPVSSSSGFKVGSRATIDSEIVAVCAIPDGTHLTVGVSACPNVDGRGTDTANGAGAAASHIAGAKVQGRVVAWHQNQGAAETIAIETKLHNEMVNVRDFGAKCDGSTDDSTALQTAITYAIGHSKTLNVPTGVTCVHSATLNMNIGNQSLHLRGAGGQAAGASIMLYTGTGTGWLWKNGNGAGFGNFIYNPVVEDIAFEVNHTVTYGLETYELSEGEFHNVSVLTSGGGSFGVNWFCSGCNIMNLMHVITNNSTVAAFDFQGCAVLLYQGGDSFNHTGSVFRFSGITSNIEIADSFFEQQNIIATFDDSLTAAATNILNGLNVHGNRMLFDGGVIGFPDGLIFNMVNTGTKALIANGIVFSANTALFAFGASSTAYPMTVTISNTTNFQTAVWMAIKDNVFDGATAGILTVSAPNRFKVHAFFDHNYSTDAANTALPGDAAGVLGFTSIKQVDSSILFGMNPTHNDHYFEFENLDANTGITSLGIHAGPNQASSDLIDWYDGSGNLLGNLKSSGDHTHSRNTGIYFNGIPGGTRWYQFTSGSETGSNAGTNLAWCRYSDASSLIDCPVNVARQTGLVTLADGVLSPTLKTGTGSNTDLTGTVTLTAATTGTYAFAGTYTSPPLCTITPLTDPTAAGVHWVTITNTVLTIHQASAVTLSYIYVCIGRN